MVFIKMLRIVLWSFFGVRKRASHEADFAAVRVSLLPFVAVTLAACFGTTLFLVAKMAIRLSH